MENEFKKIPRDVLQIILSSLPIEDLSTICLVCKDFNNAMNSNDQVWKVCCLNWWKEHNFHTKHGNLETIERESKIYHKILSWKWFAHYFGKWVNLPDDGGLAIGTVTDNNMEGLGIKLEGDELFIGHFHDDELNGDGVWYSFKVFTKKSIFSHFAV